MPFPGGSKFLLHGNLKLGGDGVSPVIQKVLLHGNSRLGGDGVSPVIQKVKLVCPGLTPSISIV